MEKIGHKWRLAVALGLLFTAGDALAATDYHSGIWNLLRAAHFRFADNGDSRARRGGTITAGGKQYEIWRHIWEETPAHMRASTLHGHYNIQVFERTKSGLSFLGHYDDDGQPMHIQGRTIKFSYPPDEAKLGDSIRFDDNGPPAEILLNGENHAFRRAGH